MLFADLEVHVVKNSDQGVVTFSSLMLLTIRLAVSGMNEKIINQSDCDLGENKLYIFFYLNAVITLANLKNLFNPHK